MDDGGKLVFVSCLGGCVRCACDPGVETGAGERGGVVLVDHDVGGDLG